jgi:DNA repair protein RecN (Recombination protein N)
MLVKLSIKNYILIQDLEIDFSEGFSVITGETGAGKTILLGAFTLILGQRADSGILFDKTKKCFIEGSFIITNYNLEEFFEVNGLDFEDSITLRREINHLGKSRAFINDTPVNLSLLKELGDRLVNIHSQNSIVTLNDTNFQLSVIDSYAAIQTDVSEYTTAYFNYVKLKRQIVEIETHVAKAAIERDYCQFMLNELTSSQLKPGELEEIEGQLDLLTHAEEVKGSLYDIVQMMSGSDENILSRFSEIIHIINNIAKYRPELKNLADRININYIDIKDIAKDFTIIEQQISIDPPKIQSFTQRLDYLHRLMKKHQVASVDQLLVIIDDLQKRVSNEVEMEEKLDNLHKKISDLKNDLLVKAKVISSKRQKVIPEFEKNVIQLLTKLGITNARFSVEILTSETISEDGTDKVKFLFSANKGIELRDLSSAASGGELSRIMLSIKSMISQKNLLPTIIFDEIDNGVSGDIAGKVGNILRRMGSYMQVVAITHLPQIAAKGDKHYWVYKLENNQTAATYIKLLSQKERIGEIAKMLSNEKVTDSAIQTANELINS